VNARWCTPKMAASRQSKVERDQLLGYRGIEVPHRVIFLRMVALIHE
jgi:hypothetical protein